MKDQFTIWHLFVFLVVYSIISVFFFIFTSGGWTSLIYVYLGIALYGIILLTMLGIGITKYTQGKRIATFNSKYFISAVALQLISLPFNIGDCGDNGGGYTLWQKVIYGYDEMCHSVWERFTENDIIIFLPLLLVYLILLIMFLFSIRFIKRNI